MIFHISQRGCLSETCREIRQDPVFTFPLTGNTFMRLIFVCPENQETFETDHFNIIEDKGIKITETGQRVWDAKVALASACPCCGKIHEYQVSELPCPWR